MKKRGDSYGVFGLNGKNISAHRASYLLFRGPIPEGLHVLHRCDVRCCVNPHHLWLGTNLENVRDRDQKGRRAPMFGANHPQHKLIESEVVDILASSLTAREAADAYGVCVSNIYYIRSKKTWRHVRLDFDAKHGQCGAVA